MLGHLMMAFCLNQPDLLVLFGIARGLFPIVFLARDLIASTVVD